MHSFVSFNDRIVSAAEVNLSAAAPAALYGKGIFTTLEIFRSEPFLWKKHWQRLISNADRVEIDLSGFKRESVLLSLQRIIEKNQITDARCRLTFFDTSAGSIWKSPAGIKTNLLIQTAEAHPVRTRSLRVDFSPFPVNSRSPLAGVKSCNYLENLLALERAKADGFEEAVRLNERGEVVSACLANIFWISAGRLYTPDLETGCLAGTTREFILELAEAEGLPFETVGEKKSGLLAADEVFLTSSGIGIGTVGEIGGRRFKDEVSGRLRKIFRENKGREVENFRS
ncbi:MAG: aminotransferase class IV [Pyrinomonadaceae bacterium]